MDFEMLANKIKEAKGSYYRLLLVLNPFADTNTKFLKEGSKLLNQPYINFSLILAGKLMDIPIQRRRYQIVNLLPNLVRNYPEEVLFFDHIELLFLPELEVDPLRALQQISRNKTIVVGWTGVFEDNKLTYASQRHPEYKRYQGLVEEDFVFLNS
ncbi:MAG: BREX-3 system P-loop-containing protein BrxF [Syntrophomonadaceae bacterium]|nr:BREX-3 system P-loop-containing protein BrxF [Syntrophomonadaceae bacterium]